MEGWITGIEEGMKGWAADRWMGKLMGNVGM